MIPNRFVLSVSRPTGDRLTRYISQTSQFATEAEGVAAFRASKGKAMLTELLPEIGKCRPILRRAK
jgi:hypothetical protein